MNIFAEEQTLSKKVTMVLMTMLIVVSAFFALGVDTADAAFKGSGGGTGSGSQENLRSHVDDVIADKKYTAKTGDTINGRDLVKNGITTERFNDLTGKQKQKLIDDMDQAVNSKMEKDKDKGASGDPVTQNTKSNWLQELQQQPGVGSKLLSNITAQVKPDYVTGNRIFEPFAGPMNTFIALVVIVTMSFLALTFVFDLMFLNIPMFQSFVTNSMQNGGGGGGGGRFQNFFVGREALIAVEESENNSNGKFKNPNGLYLKHRFIGIALLGLCLLYLIQGQIFDIVGMIMDLLGGFLINE